MSFLTAEWRNLALANYSVSPSVLQPFLPAGVELDLWGGTCYVSLVGFLFRNTKLLGFKIPGHVNFEEVNLRFYVRRLEQGEWKRGVVFVKEIVPRRALAFIANTLYRERYETMPMRHSQQTNDREVRVEYGWLKNGVWQTFAVRAENQATAMQPGSEVEFITEHYWGYTRISAKATNEYQVTHPRWLTYAVLDYSVQVDFGAVYGPGFAFLQDQEPLSVMLAEGSAITVEPGRRLRLP